MARYLGSIHVAWPIVAGFLLACFAAYDLEFGHQLGQRAYDLLFLGLGAIGIPAAAAGAYQLGTQAPK